MCRPIRRETCKRIRCCFRKIRTRKTAIPGTQEDESAYWEKDQSADAQGRPQNSQRADYLFEDQQVPDAENQNSLTINKPNTDTDTQPPQQSNAQQTTVQQPENGNTQTPGYDIIDDKDNADIIINNPTQVPNPLPSNGGNNNNGDSNTPGEDNNGTNPAAPRQSRRVGKPDICSAAHNFAE